MAYMRDLRNPYRNPSPYLFNYSIEKSVPFLIERICQKFPGEFCAKYTISVLLLESYEGFLEQKLSINKQSLLLFLGRKCVLVHIAQAIQKLLYACQETYKSIFSQITTFRPFYFL